MKGPNYRYFEDVRDDRNSNKLFIKFAIIVMIFYLIIVSCSWIFYTKYSYVSITGLSMQPTYNANPVYVKNDDEYDLMQDGVFILKTQEITYGDVIILRRASDTDKDTIIKRTMALGGDYVSIVQIKVGQTYEYRFIRADKNTLQPEIIEEDYIKSYEEWSSFSYFELDDVRYENDFYTNYLLKDPTIVLNVPELDMPVQFVQVPDGHVFFMGDNRRNSLDSRSTFKTFPLSRVVGKVIEFVNNGTNYPGNTLWLWNRIKGFFSICWEEICRIFG